MKVNKIPKFYMIFARILTKYIVICHENIFPDFFFGGGGNCPLCMPRLLRLCWLLLPGEPGLGRPEVKGEDIHHRHDPC